jgi:hypothetical protein
MHSRWRRAAAAIALTLLGLVLAGCDASGTVVVQADDKVAIDLVVSGSDLGVIEDGASVCPAQINSLTVAPMPTPNGTVACRITGTIQPSEFEQVATLTTVGEYQVLRVGLQSDSLSDGEVDLTIRFPGDVLQASNGQIEGNSVKITRLADFTGLAVVALNRPGPADRVIWAVAGVVGTLLVVGALWLVLHRRTPHPVPPADAPADGLGLLPSDGPAGAATAGEPFAPEPPPADPVTDPAVHDHSIWAPPQDGGPVD